jgi:hypothetical protein
MCYNYWVESARFLCALRTMLACPAVLLTRLESPVPCSILISIQNAPLSPLESALVSRSQLVENTAALSLAECAVTALSSTTPLDTTLTKNTRGGGRVQALRTHLVTAPGTWIGLQIFAFSTYPPNNDSVAQAFRPEAFLFSRFHHARSRHRLRHPHSRWARL